MKNAFLLLLATAAALYAQQQPQPSPPLKWTEPVPAQVIGQIPPGWQIVELKDQKITHGPFQLPDGQWVTLTTPKYVLQPMLDNGSLYLLEPGFNPKDPSGNPRAGTLSTLLYSEMEALRVSSENLRPIMAQFAKVQEYVQQQSWAAAVPPSASNQKSLPLEEQTPPLQATVAPTPSPDLAPAPTPLPASSPAPAQGDASPAPSLSPTSSPSPRNAHHQNAKKPGRNQARPPRRPRPRPQPQHLKKLAAAAQRRYRQE